MTNILQINPKIERAVADAVGQLVRTRIWGNAVNVTLPLFYPSGSAVCLGVEASRFGFSITDNGLAYREVDLIGGATYFAKNVGSVVEGTSVSSDTRALKSEATAEALATAMAEVGAASSRIAWKISSKVSQKGQAEIADYLYERLHQIFGSLVERSQKLIGPSTKVWDVDAVVHLEDRVAIFQAVSNHHMSVYPTVAMFHDLSLSDAPPATIGVVKSKADMGFFFNILSQSGHVIEEAQTDNVYQKAAMLASADDSVKSLPSTNRYLSSANRIVSSDRRS